MNAIKPRARSSRLVLRDLGDELLVYDLERHKAYCLNRVARQVFRHCDGDTRIQDMAVPIGDALGMRVDEQSVRLGLLRLEKAHLLEHPVGLALRASRREVLRNLGRAAMVVVPLVTAISVPTSAQAQASGVCPTLGAPCRSTADCGNPSQCKCNPAGFCGPA
jgi:hypothetical protein